MSSLEVHDLVGVVSFRTLHQGVVNATGRAAGAMRLQSGRQFFGIKEESFNAGNATNDFGALTFPYRDLNSFRQTFPVTQIGR